MNDLDARARIAAGLCHEGPQEQAERRQHRAAADFRRDATLDQLRAQHKADAAAFERNHGSRGLLLVALYDAGAKAAGLDLTAPEEEA